MAAANAAENHGDEWPEAVRKLDLIFTMRDMYITSNLDPLTKFSSSSRNAKV